MKPRPGEGSRKPGRGQLDTSLGLLVAVELFLRRHQKAYLPGKRRSKVKNPRRLKEEKIAGGG
jgi:hypothetical protein